MFTGTGRAAAIPEGAKLIQADIEAEEIGRARDVDVALVGDVRETLIALMDRARGRKFQDHTPWLQALSAAKAAFRKLHDEPAAREEPIHQSRLARDVADVIAGDGIIVADGGETSLWMAEQAVVLNAGDFLSHGYLGCLGVGIAFAIAAKVTHPEKRVVSIVGDGSAGLNIAEFDTAVRNGIPIVRLVSRCVSLPVDGGARRPENRRVTHAEAGPVADGTQPGDEPVDGRRAWRDRNRLAVVDALLDLYAEGNLKPGAQEVAERSGVSRRSVFRYFEDLDDLDRAAIQRQQERVIHLIELKGVGEGSLEERIGQVARQRASLWEAVLPAARVSRLRAPFYHVIAEELAESRRFLARQLERQFATELNAMTHTARTRVLAAADVLCSFEAFDLLTTGRGMSPAEIRATTAAALSALFASSIN